VVQLKLAWLVEPLALVWLVETLQLAQQMVAYFSCRPLQSSAGGLSHPAPGRQGWSPQEVAPVRAWRMAAYSCAPPPFSGGVLLVFAHGCLYSVL
jgi:hypothetical protein